MVRVITSTVVILLTITVNYSICLKWIPIQSGDDIPKNSIRLGDGGKTFVGRARHYDEILLAEINSTSAVVESCDKKIIKRQFEILVNSSNCRWQTISQIENVPENIVRGGTASSGEPTYVGRISRNQNSYSGSDSKQIYPIYLTSKSKNNFQPNDVSVLVCDNEDYWIDTTSENIPNNTISGGLSSEKDSIYIARLKSGCSIIPGQVVPELGIASAVYKHERLQAKYCQVLVGETKKYSWITAKNGDIPDYSVVGSQEKTGELMYLARRNKTLGYVTPLIAAKANTTYEILVRNLEN